ncbi:tyrosine-protein phosphatase [Nonomuraea sp. NPDC050556]|uniref:tyrosine-protein phosphatase n=1 Tax=Nonomuraea sp. NPDC050556 TaxID=3364369 RepID=UPI00379B2D00
MTRHIKFANIHNFRDVGGYAAKDGRTVQWQRLYRSDSPHWLTGDDIDAFHALKIRTVIDLRHPAEVEKRGRAPHAEGMSYLNLPVEGRPWNIADFDEKTGVGRFLADRYLEVTEDGIDHLRQAVTTVADADNAPVVVHCAAGKDRTGLLIAMILTLVGVPEDVIVEDYALTGLAYEKFVADWKTRHQDVKMWPGFGAAPAEAMTLFLADMAARHGSVEDYCAKTLGIDAETVERLKLSLLSD